MSVWTGLFIGLGVGLLLSLPAAAAWSRLAERRVLRSQKRAQRAERLAELGTMTGGLAHEIKNPLSTIGLNVQLLQEDLDDAKRELPEDAHPDHPRLAARDADLRDRLDRVSRRLDGLHRETQRLRDILDDFLKFAGRLQLHREDTDLHGIVEELADFFAPQADDAGVQLRLDLHAAEHTVSVDAGLLKQALLNLMLNATQAMTQARSSDQAHGGANELHLRTSLAERDKQRKRGSSGGTHRGVCIHVTDTGPGIPEDVLPRVFEPYFSKKRGGTGLGLPTTKRIIEEHGGSLTVHSEPSRGTSFTITLPLAEPETKTGSA
ncbi:MAG: ATP-binding protein [Planctomycetota bacterium]